jgi:hypothetical protein
MNLFAGIAVFWTYQGPDIFWKNQEWYWLFGQLKIQSFAGMAVSGHIKDRIGYFGNLKKWYHLQEWHFLEKSRMGFVILATLKCNNLQEWQFLHGH